MAGQLGSTRNVGFWTAFDVPLEEVVASFIQPAPTSNRTLWISALTCPAVSFKVDAIVIVSVLRKGPSLIGLVEMWPPMRGRMASPTTRLCASGEHLGITVAQRALRGLNMIVYAVAGPD